jgi:hypothetical protein
MLKRDTKIEPVKKGYRVTFFKGKKPVDVQIYRDAYQADDASYTWQVFGEYQMPY